MLYRLTCSSISKPGLKMPLLGLDLMTDESWMESELATLKLRFLRRVSLFAALRWRATIWKGVSVLPVSEKVCHYCQFQSCTWNDWFTAECFCFIVKKKKDCQSKTDKTDECKELLDVWFYSYQHVIYLSDVMAEYLTDRNKSKHIKEDTEGWFRVGVIV